MKAPKSSIHHFIGFVLVALAASASGQAEPLRILCIGDGNTTGYTDNPYWTKPFEFGYRSGLYSRLVAGGYTVQFTGDSIEPWSGAFGLPTNTPTLDLRNLDQDHHRGYAGLGTTLTLSAIGTWVAIDHPDVVLLMVGLDDSNIPIATSNLTGIVQTIVTNWPLVDVIVAQVTPLFEYSQFIADYNTFIRSTLVPSFQAQGKRVSTVDQYHTMLTDGAIDPALFSNGLNHPSAEAYDRMAQNWYLGIRAVRPPVSKIRFTGIRTTSLSVILNGTGGPPNTSFTLLQTTNSLLSFASWLSRSPNGVFDSAGAFSYTGSVSSPGPNTFYRIKVD